MQDSNSAALVQFLAGHLDLTDSPAQALDKKVSLALGMRIGCRTEDRIMFCIETLSRTWRAKGDLWPYFLTTLLALGPLNLPRRKIRRQEISEL